MRVPRDRVPELSINAAPTKLTDLLSVIATNGSSQIQAKTLDLGKTLNQIIRNNGPLDSLIKLIWMDCRKFLEPTDPVIDIYEQMLANNCPEFDNRIPDNRLVGL